MARATALQHLDDDNAKPEVNTIGMCPCDPADPSGNVEVSRKLPDGSQQANALAVNLNGRDVNPVSSFYGTSPLFAAVARNREVRGLGPLREGNRDVPRWPKGCIDRPLHKPSPL